MSDNNELKYSSEVEVLRSIIPNIEEIKETHISYAILTDEYVYKVKKAVDFGFLNYKTLKSRRLYSILEQELNDRFSKDVYVGVFKLVETENKVYALVPYTSSLSPIEYVLKMRRIKDDAFLMSKLDSKKLSLDEVEKVGSEVAKLLQNLEPAPFETVDGFVSNFDTVAYNARENFEQTEKYVGSLIDKEYYDFIKKESRLFLDNHKDLFNERYLNGFVKNGHGDLRLDHIYFNNDGTIGLIDCIEFNKRFRFNDIISELAFLSMELDSSKNIPTSDAFTKGFLREVSDSNSLILLNYYKSYLAYVRVKIAAFTLESLDPESSVYKDKVVELKRLVKLSAYYIMIANKPTTLLFFGLMATGKSKNATLFSDAFPVVKISSDNVRKAINNVNLTDKVYVDFDADIYSKEVSYKLYEEIAKMVNVNLSIGRSSIIDASFTDSKYYDIVKSNIKTNLFNIKFTSTEEVISIRLKSRLTRTTVTDGRPQIYEEQKQKACFPKEDLIIDTTGKMNKNTKKIFSAMIVKK